jgi:L-threonylcarbamoyladenylate synthase
VSPPRAPVAQPLTAEATGDEFHEAEAPASEHPERGLVLFLKTDPNEPDRADLRRAATILSAGGLVAYPTDTLYGLAVDPRRDDAVERLYRVKRRDPNAAVPLIAGSLEQALAAGTFTDAELRLARAFWPGPLSIVVPASQMISRRLFGPGATIAVRVPAHPVARALAEAFESAITATSANRSGERPATTAEDTRAALGENLDAIVDAGPAPGGAPSTIVQLTREGPQLLRAGAIAWERVLEFVE